MMLLVHHRHFTKQWDTVDLPHAEWKWQTKPKLGQMAKTRQKYFLKIGEIDESLLCLQQFDKFSIQKNRM